MDAKLYLSNNVVYMMCDYDIPANFCDTDIMSSYIPVQQEDLCVTSTFAFNSEFLCLSLSKGESYI